MNGSPLAGISCIDKDYYFPGDEYVTVPSRG